MASFQAKIGWKRPRKRKNKNSLSVPFLPYASDRNETKQNETKIFIFSLFQRFPIRFGFKCGHYGIF